MFAAMHFYLLKVRLALEGGTNGEEEYLTGFLVEEIYKMGYTFFHQKQVSFLHWFQEDNQMRRVLVDFWTELDLAVHEGDILP